MTGSKKKYKIRSKDEITQMKSDRIRSKYKISYTIR
mgnify:FL=1